MSEESSQAREKFLALNEKMLQVNQQDIFEDTHVYTYYRNPVNYKIDRLSLQMKMVKEQLKLLQQQIDKISECLK